MTTARKIFAVLLCVLCCTLAASATTKQQRAALDGLLQRIGGNNAHRLILTEVDPKLAAAKQQRQWADSGATVSGSDVFVISQRKGRPLITGSSLSATTAGLGWYLRHYANTDIGWQQPQVDLSAVTLTVPEQPERHQALTDIRYYLNYCTFSYSLSTWTWERWQREIDWMALHGINAPLQIVGLDVVWRNLLMNEYGYTKEQADDFIAGPCFQAWWGMNNLEGWGGPNPDWWYKRQEQLSKNILKRQRELGMQPVLPGYSGMVPSSFTKLTGIPTIEQGKWCRFQRPYIINPNDEGFASVAAKYYAELERLMGQSVYYSMDPFHEGANTRGVDVPKAYRAIYEAMNRAKPGSVWVIQQWQWSKPQYSVLDQVPVGQLLVLDLFSDGRFGIGKYGPHETVFCSLPNFGARTGMYGRLQRMTDEWQHALRTPSNLTGIGTAPEGIGQNQVQYDLLYELAWMDRRPDLDNWIADYAKARYGQADGNALTAWQLLLQSALNCPDSRQGPHEAMMCARPQLDPKSASAWGSCEIYYDTDKLAQAARALAKAELSGSNYCFDLVDVTRQALTDYGQTVMQRLQQAAAAGDSVAMKREGEHLCQLILDVDSLLNTHPDFMIGTWTESARAMAREVDGTTEADADWLELNNARTLITTWGAEENCNRGELRDYSYRQAGGMLRDFYLPRWQAWFADGMADRNWYPQEHAWAMDSTRRYPVRPQPLDAPLLRRLAIELLDKYLRN